MTCLAAVITDTEAVLACDTMIASGELLSHVRSKVAVVGPLLVGWTGWSSAQTFLDLFREVDVPSDAAAAARQFSTAWREWASENRMYGAEGASGETPVAWLLAAPGAIWTVASPGTALKHDASWWAMGSGAELAAGALEVLDALTLSPTEKAQRAVQAAINRSPYCGGEVVVERAVKPQRVTHTFTAKITEMQFSDSTGRQWGWTIDTVPPGESSTLHDAIKARKEGL